VAQNLSPGFDWSPSLTGHQPATQQIDNLRYRGARPAHAGSGLAIFNGN
jgi:hypothetical protein